MEKIIEENEFIDSCDSEYTKFIEHYKALQDGKCEFFIGALYYDTFCPSLTECNNTLIGNKSILEFKSPSYEPYYATIFINERQALTPDLLSKWTKKVCRELLKKDFDFQIAEIPTREQTLALYKEDYRL